MSGLAALFDPTGMAIDPQVVASMGRALAPRGPDAEGTWFGPGAALAHRWLKLTHESVRGNQPMTNAAGNVHLVFDGEVYNFLDLRAELMAHGHSFRSRSDTEVLLAAYACWGHEMLAHIDGAFAFVVWDELKQEVFAARDRMGKKPLYYARVRRQAGLPPLLGFASELKALLAIPGFDRSLSPAALGRYLTFGYVPAPLTMFENARKLDASESLACNLQPDDMVIPRPQRYWDLPFPPKHEALGADETAANVWDLLRRAVERRLVADVPLGVLLSGGLHSAAIAAAVHAVLGGGQGLATFSLGFAGPRHHGDDDCFRAGMVAKHLGSSHQEHLVDANTILNVLPQVARSLDEPLADPSVLRNFLLSRFARQRVTVALNGDGGQAVFGGAPSLVHQLGARLLGYLPTQLQHGLRAATFRFPERYDGLHLKLSQLVRGGNLPGPRRHQRWVAPFLPEELGQLLTRDVQAQLEPDPLSPLDARIAATNAQHSDDVLMDYHLRFDVPGHVNVRADQTSASVGLETRSPFLDTDLIRYACLVPPSLQRRGGRNTYVLKHALRDRLPAQIINSHKRSVGFPMSDWLKEDLAPLLADELAAGKLAREGFFQPQAIQTLLEEHHGTLRDHAKPLWTLLSFQLWLAEFGQGTVSA